MWLQGTNDIIKALKEFYTENYKVIFNNYKVDLDFATILTYYSGNCALVIDINSIPEATTVTNMCIMLECTESDIKDLSEEALHRLFQSKILNKYKGILELNLLLSNKRNNRKIIIKNTNYNEAVFNLKLEKDVIQIELNYSRINEINNIDKDLYNVIDGLNEHLRNLS
jgi:hypothetical protein